MKFNFVKPKKMGIRTQIFLGFGIFTALVIAIIWIFQIALLNSFYKFIKQEEIKSTAQLIEREFESENLTTILEDIVINSDTDVLIVTEFGETIIQATSMKSSFFDRITQLQMMSMYTQTEASGGEFLQNYTLWDFSKGINANAFMLDNSFQDRYSSPEALVFLKTMTTADGENVLMLLSTMVTPVDSTVETLKFQLWSLTALMILFGLMVAVFISKKISKPIIQITSGAKELSKGNYDIDFNVNGGGHEILELSSTLNVAAKELNTVETLRKELIANVSHDLRTPLTMISGYAEVMRDIPGENTPENIQIIIDEATRLKNLVNDLLDISKLESGNQTITMKPVNLTQSIKNILLRYDKLVDYSFDFYHGSDIYVLGDELKLSQVIYNLVNNAVTYTGEDKRIVLTQSVINDNITIKVEDSGIGIPKDKLKNIWQRYYKVEKEHKRAQIGTGLGLSIVSQILDLHGGTYGVFSEEGKGSCFWFTLKTIDYDEFEI